MGNDKRSEVENSEGVEPEEDTGSEEPPARDAETREHLANERTLLAWVRTGVGLISVGFVVERAGALAAGNSGGSATLVPEIFGLALVGLGCLTLLVGSMEFFGNRRMIHEGKFIARSAPYMVIVGGSLLLAVAFIVYVVFIG